jgi:hypothetical protein
VTELAGFLPSVHPNLFHTLIENLQATAIPADPDFAADQLGRRFVKGFFDFHLAVPMDAAASFLEAGKSDAGSGGKCGRSSSKQAATCLRVVPWMRLPAPLWVQEIEQSVFATKYRPLLRIAYRTRRVLAVRCRRCDVGRT